MYIGTITKAPVVALIAFLLCPLCAIGTPALSATCGSGANNIPDATVDGTGTTIPSGFSCGLLLNAPGTVAAGNAITVGLLGFIHEASGDLIITLTHYSDVNKSSTYGATQTLFHRIGKLSTDPNDFGYSAQFGDLSGGENYSFNSGAATNLWTTASMLGSADFIPGASAGFSGAYTTHGAFSSNPSNFSAQFTGQPIAGFWELYITDNAVGPSGPSVAGSLLQFSLDINSSTNVPEPGSGLLLMLGLTGLALLGKR